jgi:hypothetical protein
MGLPDESVEWRYYRFDDHKNTISIANDGLPSSAHPTSYDNETGKSNHKHIGGIERPYRFVSPQ